ncbi:MAG: ferritin family protein [Rhodobacterales bacterium]|nr:ferritin family protein [Rhodobacterales bacterium]
MTDSPPTVDTNTVAMDTVEEFLAHAHTLEAEASDRFNEMADSMEIHNNLEVAKLFRRLAHEGQKHAGQMLERAGGRELPSIAPWDLKLGGHGESPEAPSMEQAHYLMTPYHALDLARQAEMRVRDYYAAVAEASTNTDVVTLANELAAEEAEHVALIDEWITKYPKPEKDWDFDPDPPVLP